MLSYGNHRKKINDVSSRAYIDLLSHILLILVTILKTNLIPLHQPRVILKLLTNLPILQTIDLIFTSNPTIIVHSNSENFLCSSCHHDIIYGKNNVSVVFPPQHFRTIWDYKNANASSVQRVTENFNSQWKEIIWKSKSKSSKCIWK